VLLDASADGSVVRRARELVDEGRAAGGRAGRARVTVYTEVDPVADPASLAARVAERVAELAEAGADTVVLQATGEAPDPRPLLAALPA
jgi:hypothetical protein